MKKKFLLIGGALAVGALALSSCGSKARERAKSKELPEATEFLDVAVTYSDKKVYASAGDTFVNPIDGNTYTANQSLLPAWKHYASVLSDNNSAWYAGRSVTIRDGIKHSNEKPEARYTTDVVNGFVTTNENLSGEKIDLYQNTTTVINTMGDAGKAVNLLDYIDYMPNFKKYLDENPVIEDQITVDGKIYYTPYMDGSDYYERIYQMDAYGVEKLLDNGLDAAFDSESATSEGRINFTANKVTPFVNADYNYAADQKVKILFNGKAEEVTIKKTTNIIKQQNEYLAAGKTGAELAKQFINYLNDAYGDIKVGGTKVYDKLSKVFIGESAIYNTDDLIALFRVFKANPKFISNDKIPNAKVATVYPFTVRQGSSTDRVENVLGFIGNLYGVQGLGSEKDRLFFTTDGYWADAATEQATYDALERANALYQEGLIQKTFQDNVKFGDNAFGRNKGDSSTYSLMLNDYTAVPAKYNAVDANGVGTGNQAAGFEASKLQPVLAPLTYWATDGFTHGAALTAREGKSLTRYFEETRSLKAESWCIPSTTDNLAAAIKLMDYLMAKEGQVYSDFCTPEYWAKDDSNTSDNFKGYKLLSYGVDTTPQFSDAVITWSGSHGIGTWSDWWTFCRGALGTTFGVGYIRTSTIDYQSTNIVARGGADALQKATNAGVNNKSNLTSKIKFGTAVPAAGYPNITDDVSTEYDAITTFWGTTSDKIKTTTAYGWIKAVQDPTFADTTVLGVYKNTKREGANYTFADVKAQFEARNKKYLGTFANYYSNVGTDIGDGYGKVPTYAK